MPETADEKQAVLSFLSCKGEIPGATEQEKFDYAYLDTGFIDSMEVVELIMELESRFNIKFPVEDMQSKKFRTVGGLISMVKKLRNTPV
jgi:D-alanine--poly(phosphoribitol) ligase subunit 2